MNAPTPPTTAQPQSTRRPLLTGVLILLVVVLGGLAIITRPPPGPELSSVEVRKGDLLISVVEGGTIEAVNEVVVRSEFEGTARIIFIVREGTYVKKGDILVELDSSQAQDQVNQQQINHEKSMFALTQAEQQLTIQKSVVDGSIQAAELKLKFAQIDLEKFQEGDREQSRRNAEIEITNVVESLKLKEDSLGWTRRLFEKGWETKTKLDQDELAVSQLRLKKEQSEKAFELLKKFEETKKQLTLEAAVQEAKENLERVKLQGDRLLAQYQADVETQKSTLELSAKKLERDRRQLDACKIKAPQDGLVVYAGGGDRGRFSSESMVEEGAVVRNRQELIKLPDIADMKLEVKIHEAHINSIRQGQQAFVVLDSMPDKRFQGIVNRVGLVPDSMSRFGNPNLKLYATQIVITDKLPDVKPGVSARAEIVITNLVDVVAVPIQAVTTRKGKQVVFLAEDPPKPVPVTVGHYNIKFIEISSGLEPGQRILLAPPFGSDEKDLGGSVIAKGEALPARPTNGIPRAAMQPGIGPAGMGFPGPGQGPGMAPTPGGPGMAGGPGGPGGAPQAEGAPGGGRGGRGPRAIPEELLKQYDKNGDGQLDEAEREPMMAAMRERFGAQGGGPGGRGGGPRLSNEEMLKQYDKNGDGQIDETERETMRAAMRAARGTEGGGRGEGGARPEGGRGEGRPAGGPRAPGATTGTSTNAPAVPPAPPQ